MFSRRVVITTHARSRLLERYGVELTPEDGAEILTVVEAVTRDDLPGTSLDLVLRTRHGKIGAVAVVYPKVVMIVTMHAHRRSGSRKFVKKVLKRPEKLLRAFRDGRFHGV